MDAKEWAQCAIILRACYPTTFKVGEQGLLVWFQMLQDLPFDRVAAAITYMAKTQEAFPSVAAIRKLAEPPAAGADEAWAEVMRYANSPHVFSSNVLVGGRQVSWEWSDPVIPHVLAGYQDGREIALADTERLATIRAQFRRDYEAARRRADQGAPIAPRLAKRLATTMQQQELGLQVLPGGIETQIVRSMPDGE